MEGQEHDTITIAASGMAGGNRAEYAPPVPSALLPGDRARQTAGYRRRAPGGVAAGCRPREIADCFHLSIKTIATFRENLKEKPELKHITVPIRFAVP